MTLPLLIVRPEHGAIKTAARAIELGLMPIVDPLFQMEALSWDVPETARYDALLLTSANAVQYGGAKFCDYAALPVLAVGEATAAAAKLAGFNVAAIGTGGVDALLCDEDAKPFARLLHLTGKHSHKAETRARAITTIPVYEAAALQLGRKARAILDAPCVVLVHSARAAHHFAAEIDRVGLNRSQISLAVISPTVAEQAGKGWAALEIAATPGDDALLTVAERLCHVR